MFAHYIGEYLPTKYDNDTNQGPLDPIHQK